MTENWDNINKIRIDSLKNFLKDIIMENLVLFGFGLVMTGTLAAVLSVFFFQKREHRSGSENVPDNHGFIGDYPAIDQPFNRVNSRNER